MEVVKAQTVELSKDLKKKKKSSEQINTNSVILTSHVISSQHISQIWDGELPPAPAQLLLTSSPPQSSCILGIS